MASARWAGGGGCPLPSRKKNGNQIILRCLVNHFKIILLLLFCCKCILCINTEKVYIFVNIFGRGGGRVPLPHCRAKKVDCEKC